MSTEAIGDAGEQDEFKPYQIGRYILSNESIRKIYGFDIHEQYPIVVNLAVHPEKSERVDFIEDVIHHLAHTPP